MSTNTAPAPAAPASPAPAAAPVAPSQLSLLTPSEPAPGTTAAPDSTPASGQGQSGGETPKVEAPAAAVEAKYELKLPEGFVADDKRLDAYRDWAKKAGLTPEQASANLEFYAEQLKANEAHLTSLRDSWAKEFAADKDFGGAKLDASLAIGRKAVVVAGAEAEIKALEELGIGNHPAVLRLIVKFGRQLGEDSSTKGRGDAAPVKDPQARLRERYPSMFNQDGSPKR